MSIKILKPGLFTTVQDMGRYRHQFEGYSPAGVLDRPSYEILNTLLETDNQAALEVTMIGPKIKFLRRNLMALTGAQFSATLNNEPIPHQTVIKVEKGDILDVGKVKKGMRGYIGFAEILDIPKVEGSYSTHTRTRIGGYKGRQLKENDILKTKPGFIDLSLIGRSSDYSSFNRARHLPIGIMDGPQLESFTRRTIKEIEQIEFKISESSDRMGYRLKGQSIQPFQSADIISEPVALGSVQVPKDGNPIILLNDRQTVGGYTKIGTVIDCDIVDIVQKQPGESIKFEWITFNEANEILARKRRKLDDAKAKIRKQPQRFLKNIRPTQQKIKTVLKGDQLPWT
ncbi:biotin-dependent carboxyltransferase family protein [Staphylococcus coagulans]|uniref:5-oxoprolinase subunit C family protein n=1 Tax=Staphylococcus coagulans TaxID=74706 RepID=UPI0015F99E7C|nr:biotin-dependent carboxyltransferase family protein [Staphylococcus coagulans]MBA8763212.1 5-oxoprolinase/urea amidolyase family protein [Staphylococcus coagulans]MBT2808788.1 biotin-dependent carboxyltransferase family protein [Staphylococcus coagulans]MBT2811033.1 biotin-dependent carboxyltransferase family protein [Staphylococcus coagulans]MBT2818737.1 biotin-dependent carboxyltransferase family protein [Staphylococcus coagulans]MBT2820223.1 biotin-dependent carboxyltransferase family pr